MLPTYRKVQEYNLNAVFRRQLNPSAAPSLQACLCFEVDDLDGCVRILYKPEG